MNDQASDAKPQRARKSRRAHRPAAAGVDPHPSDHSLTSRAREDRPEGWGENGADTPVNGAAGASAKRDAANGAGANGPGARGSVAKGENDDRLKLDRPPHWG